MHLAAMIFLLTTPVHAGTARDDWALVAAYDLAAVMAADPQPRTDFTWQPRAEMEEACGPVKMPQGMGIMEAEAFSSGLSPTLALLLERPEGHEALLSLDNVQIALMRGAIREPLQPAVLPRDLEVEISGSAEDRYKQLIRTQIAMETCMEHKVGRAWRSSDARLVRQAFLLEPPGAVGDRGPSRMFFGGQWRPVPALLGPPAACELSPPPAEDGAGITISRGEGSALLVPTDVWGASLGACRPHRSAALSGGTPERLPLALSAMAGDEAAPNPRGARERLAIRIDQADGEPRIEVKLDDKVVLAEKDLFSRLSDAEPEGPEDDAPKGLTDVLAFVPYTLPTVGPRSEPDRYTLLLVPNWQLRDRFKAMSLAAPNNEELAEAMRAENAVTWLLEHPDFLVLQVRSTEAAHASEPAVIDALVDQITNLLPKDEAEGAGSGPKLPTLSTVLGQGGWGIRDWGFIVGQDRAHTPIVLPIQGSPSRTQSLTAHRAWSHGSFLLFALMGGSLTVLGMRRVRDLWTATPEERATYWPGRRADAAGPGMGSSSGPPPGDEG